MPQASEIGLLRYEDIVQPFMLHRSSVRGRLVRLAPILDTILTRHDYPPPVQRLLGELLTLGAMLSASLPENGILTLQAKGDGPVRLLVVDAVHGGRLRGYADLAKDGKTRLEAVIDAGGAPGLGELMGKGYLAITLDLGFGDPYQGIVPLEGASLSEAVQHYFTQSQQIDVLFNLVVGRRVDAAGNSSWTAGGIMLERMPDEGGHEVTGPERNPSFDEGGRMLRSLGNTAGDEAFEGWDYNALLVDTAKEDELLDPYLAPSALLYRLFNEGGVWVHEAKSVHAECRCSRFKIHHLLSSMGKEALADMQQEGAIRVTCQFCNQTEIFTLAELGEPPAEAALSERQRLEK